MLKNFFLNLWNTLLGRLTKHSLMPATIFTKKQIARINHSFEVFWGLIEGDLQFEKPMHFSTVTLGKPKNFWTYFFPSMPQINSLRASYTPHPFTFVTQDGIKLCGCHFKKTKTTLLPSRALIIFGGNGELYRIGSSGWLFKLFQTSTIDFDLILFDPRECGNSEGKAFAKGLVADGIELFSYVHTHLGFSIDAIDLYGFSLGGAVATLVKRHFIHSKGGLINNRSFQSLDKAIQEIFTPLGATLKVLVGHQAKKLASLHAWELSPLQAFLEIPAPKLLLSQRHDPVVRYRASLEKGLKDLHEHHACEIVELTPKEGSAFILNHHVQPLSFYNDQDGHDAQTRVRLFLEGLAQAFQDSF